MVATLGRLPEADELGPATEIEARFGSLNRAFSLIKRVTGASEWEAITRRCAEDLLVYLALGRSPPAEAADLGASGRSGCSGTSAPFFGSYANGCRRADELLFKAGDADAVDDACRRSAVGKLLPNALYVHPTALDALDPLLRVFEGCAHTYLGRSRSPRRSAVTIGSIATLTPLTDGLLPAAGLTLFPGVPRSRGRAGGTL